MDRTHVGKRLAGARTPLAEVAPVEQQPIRVEGPGASPGPRHPLSQCPPRSIVELLSRQPPELLAAMRAKNLRQLELAREVVFRLELERFQIESAIALQQAGSA